jgi:hypothetical protein
VCNGNSCVADSAEVDGVKDSLCGLALERNAVTKVDGARSVVALAVGLEGVLHGSV